VIMTDGVGVWNISAHHRDMMGGRTPNIDCIVNEGALFTDYDAQQSCTAGRAAFILGQHPVRTGFFDRRYAGFAFRSAEGRPHDRRSA
jgi:arylsulfatase A-like enzyme